MKKMVMYNIILLSLCALFFVLDFFVVDQITRFLFITPIILLFIEAGVFLFTFKHFKKSSLRNIRIILGIYCLLALVIFIAIKIYSGVTGYEFIYYGYSPLLMPFIIYPSILWVMIRIMTLKVMINNRDFIAIAITVFTVLIMGFNGLILIFGSSGIEIIDNPSGENVVYVTEYGFFQSWTKEYTQKNILFMEYVDSID